MRAEEVLWSGLLQVLLGTIARIPANGVGPIGGGLGNLFRWLARKDRQRLRSNVDRVYKLPPGSHFSRMFERQVFRHHGICLIETVKMLARPELMRVSGEASLRELVQRAETAGRGFVLITAHVGSWELCAYFSQKVASKPVSVLAKPAKRPALTQILAHFRRRLKAQVLWTDRRTLLKDMMRALQKGEGLGFVMDQKPEGRVGPLVDFLGIPTEFVSGPALMATRAQCPVIAVFCLREGPFSYRLVTEEILPTLHGESSVEVVTARMAQAISKVIALYPEQWTWNYKRWRDP